MLLQATLTLILTFCPFVVLAQTPVNGQIFTNGLSIIDSPALNSQFNGGGNIPIAIDVSGNGKLPSSAMSPGSGLDTAYEAIDIFLVSSQTKINITVSSGSGFLTGETGTVRHLNYVIPSCIQSGQYNMTFYERSTLEKRQLYVITPIPISIQNSSPSGSCTQDTNDLQPQPQPDVRAPQSPFLPGNYGTPITVTMTAGENPLPTVTVSGPSVTTVTVVLESPVITTAPGQTTPITSTATWTTTAAMKSEDLSGFIPVNSSNAGLNSHLFFEYFAILVAGVFVFV